MIDRRSVIQRHNPKVSALNPYAALSVGNGEFAFTADITGLQTFIDECKTDFPLCTASHWGWHTTPAPAGIDPANYKFKNFDTYGRQVGYAVSSTGQTALYNWMRENPHRLHLGRVALEMKKSDGSRPVPADLKDGNQMLDLWSGVIDSRFTLEGAPVWVQTCCHPQLDMIAVRIESPLLKSGRLAALLAFPYASSDVSMADWKSVDKHQTQADISGNRAEFLRVLDNDRYCVNAQIGAGKLTARSQHEYLISTDGDAMEFVIFFGEQHRADLPDFSQTRDASAGYWEKFWTDGAAIDLGGSTNAKAPELERRVVLSQYQTAIHCSGSLPSAETGLLFNSWYGKFHLEMHWWHSAHFVIWNRFARFAKNMDFYQRIRPVALATAQRQGYAGVRWPKMVGPDGLDSPSPIGPLLIWQQPHPIYYAELSYQHSPTDETLKTWQQIVFDSADFMASYVVADAKGRYVLGPPLKTVPEDADTLTTINPTFELAYWRFGLSTAQAWRRRMGLADDPKWAAVLAGLAPLPVQDGTYLYQEGMTDTYTKWNYEHPSILGALGMQPGEGVDVQIMRDTLKRVMSVWQWEKAWGWDFPMVAMCAARVGEPEIAVNALLMDVTKNRYHPNGHNYQRPGLTAYLPGNGGLLGAVGMMAGGWRGSSNQNAPGFPTNGEWSVKAEGFGKWL